MSDNNLNRYICPVCGIAYGLDKDVDTVWRLEGHNYCCPNAHALRLAKGTNHDEVGELKQKLATATTEATTQKKRADELQAELDIWKPRTQKEEQ
jgi:hypothetical protein